MFYQHSKDQNDYKQSNLEQFLQSVRPSFRQLHFHYKQNILLLLVVLLGLETWEELLVLFF